jgi:ABC-2 type transport system permease protein
MNLGVIAAIFRKDVVAFSRDRFYVFITVIGLGAFIAMYWLLPGNVDETIRLGVSQTGLDTLLAPVASASNDGLEIVEFDTTQDLMTAVEESTDGVVAGMAFPADFVDPAKESTVDLFVTADLPPEYTDLMEGIASQLGFLISGTEPPVNLATRTVVLGVDRAGDQVSLQEQMRPLLAFFVLMVETMALASLIAIEVQLRTVTAVLVTPARPRDFIAAKALLGTALALVEVLILLTLIRGFVGDVPVLLVALILGALMVTGVSLLAGASGRDFIGVMLLSLAIMIPLMIPAFGALFPGTAATWIRVLPTYGLVQAIVGVTTRGESWSDLGPTLALLGMWCVALLALGTVVLRRRVATL